MNNVNDDKDIKEKISYIKYYIHNYGSKNSYDEITNIIDKISFIKKEVKLGYLEKIKSHLPNIIYNSLSKFKYNLIKSNKEKQYKKKMELFDQKKFPILSLYDLNLRVSKLLSHFNYNESIDISEISSNIFLLKKRN